VDTTYYDSLQLTSFGLTVPAGAAVVGIQFDVLLNSDAGLGVDESVKALRNGAPVGADHSTSTPWPTSITYVTYGGPTDTWGTTWLATDVENGGFGISVAPRYTGTAGNDRAHIAAARATIFYATSCD